MRRSLRFRLLAMLLALVAGLALLEGAARLFLRIRATGGFLGGDPSREVFCQYDPILGYDGVPNLSAPWGDRYTISLNSEGNRDREHRLEKDERTVRIVLLGDSFAWGYSSTDEARFANLLPSKFQGGAARYPSLEVVNLAVSGYGTDQELLKFLLKGEKYRPDVVVVGFFAGNDPLENASHEYWGCPKPRFSAGPSGLRLTGLPVKRRRGWSNNRVISPTNPLRSVLGWSRLFQAIASRELPSGWLKPGAGAREAAARLPFSEIREEPDPSPVEPMGITFALFDWLNRHLQESGIPLVVLVIPSAHEYAGDDERETGFRVAMVRWLQERRIPAIDYFARTEGYRGDWAKLYLSIIEHWTPLGNEIAADLVCEALLKLKAPSEGGR